MNESIEIVNWLMKESAERQIHIICALHLNPGLSNNGETKMRGFLGTILAQKAESVIQIEKEKQNESQSKISAKDVRGRSFKPFCIEINEDGIPYFVSYGSRIEQNEYSKSNDSPF
jgi:type IV pilus biogenesis protein CpaD/CtpE